MKRIFGITALTMLLTPAVGQITPPPPAIVPDIMQQPIGVNAEILLENKDVKVTRVTIAPGATWVPDSPRLKRVIIWITGNHAERHALSLDSNRRLPEDQGETVDRDAGDAMFRTGSNHSITNRGSKSQVSVIVELKH
jgi:hypothetical protein